MRQKSIGEVLKTTREIRGLSLLEVQKLSKIQAKYLEALEYNDFDFIPDQQYTRSFLKRYAEVLDLDSDVILDAFDHNRLVRYYEEDGGEISTENELRRGHKPKRKAGSYLPLVYLLLAACFILIFVVYIVYGRLQSSSTTIDSSTSYTVVSSSSSSTSSETSTSSSTTPSSTTVESSAEKEVTFETTGGGNSLSVVVKNAEKPVEVQLSVTDVTSWVSLSGTDFANGVTLSSANQEVSMTVPETLSQTTLTLGVVQGVTVKVGGKVVDTSALTSQTGTISFTIE